MQYGIRLSLFARLGQDDLNYYKNDEPVIFDPFLLTYLEAEPIERLGPPPGFSSGNGTGISDIYPNIEPRISASYIFNPTTSIKASYNFVDPSFVVLLEVEPGIYEKDVSNSFLTDGELIFQVDHEDQLYLARTQYVPTVPINDLIQGKGTKLNGGQTEIITTFTDDTNHDDFYLFDFDFSNFFLSKDEFYQGEQFQFSYLYDKVLESGQEVDISILGIDRAFFNYMKLLLEQSDDDLELFQTPVATVRRQHY